MKPDSRTRAPAVAVVCALLALGDAPLRGGDRLRLPPIVFVSRSPAPGEPLAVPGLGPGQRNIVTGGRLMLRTPDGTVRELLASGAFGDVSDPCASPDGERIAFSGLATGDSSWAVHVLSLASGRVTRVSDRLRYPARSHDELDPAWLSDTLLCVAIADGSTWAEYGPTATTELVLLVLARAEDGEFHARSAGRITSERNGAEEPAFDRRTGRIVYTRWWFNRWRASDDDPRGITSAQAPNAARDSVNLWQIVSIRPDGSGERLEASGLGSRLASMGYQPAVLADGSLVATYASNLGLSPYPGSLGIQRFEPRIGHARRLVGALVDANGDSSYGSPRGLAAPSACCPVGLGDGRILFSYAPGGRGDFGLYVMEADGSHVDRILDLPGSLELDAAPIPERTSKRWSAWSAASGPTGANGPAAASSAGGTHGVFENPPLLAGSRADLDARARFRFVDRDVFAGDRAARGIHHAPPRTPGARVRFFTTVAGPRPADPDSAVLIREVPVGVDGSVDERLPADTPMFEQLVDAHGHVLRSMDGPAHVAGHNSGRPGATVRCIGCHTGHSTLTVPGR